MYPLRPLNECRDALADQYLVADRHFEALLSAEFDARLADAEASAPSPMRGRAAAIRTFLTDAPIYLVEDDPFADHLPRAHTPVLLRDAAYDRLLPKTEYEHLLQTAGAVWAIGDFGHTVPDWARIMRLGIPGFLHEVEEHLAALPAEDARRDFYLAVREVWDGLGTCVRRLADATASSASPNAALSHAHLTALAERAPQTLGEAMHLYFIYYMAQQHVEGENLRSLGFIDEVLLPFYLHDRAAGAEEEEIRELIRYFLLKWNAMHITANIPFSISRVPNELSYLLLEEYVALRIPDPKIHILLTPDTPPRLTALVLDSIRRGSNSFVLINDEMQIRSLTTVGISPDDAQSYTLVGCYEPAVLGKELPCTCAGRISMPMALECVLNGGRTLLTDAPLGRTTEQFSLQSFEDLLSAVKLQLSDFTDAAIHAINSIERAFPQVVRSPLFSSTFDSCMERGVDAYEGGMIYNNTSVCAIGLATLTDALLAVKGAVYEDRLLSLSELNEALRSNWKGWEELHHRMRTCYPKYGTHDRAADALAQELVLHMSDCINNRPNARGGVYRMGLFSIDWIFGAGRRMGASADGRYASEPISKNLCATPGMDRKGVTALMLSAASLDQSLAPNGAVLDLALHPSTVEGDSGLAIMESLVRTYFSKGGLAVHINVVDAETLRAAQRDPDRYRNLQVRLCGWNVYFTDLKPEVQHNLISIIEGSNN